VQHLTFLSPLIHFPPLCSSAFVQSKYQDDVTSVLSVGPAILAGSVDGILRRFDVRMGRIYSDELHHPIAELALTHDGLCVLAACLDSCLRLLDVEAGELLASYR
jgi:mitogen-activated protein kinase organizer 1